MNEEKMIAIDIYADTTGQYSEDEIFYCNTVEVRIPEQIVRDWFEENCRDVTDFECYEPTFESWLKNVYTCDDTDGLYSYSKERGYTPVCGRKCNDWAWYE